jgi:hypothetical protein
LDAIRNYSFGWFAFLRAFLADFTLSISFLWQMFLTTGAKVRRMWILKTGLQTNGK